LIRAPGTEGLDGVVIRHSGGDLVDEEAEMTSTTVDLEPCPPPAALSIPNHADERRGVLAENAGQATTDVLAIAHGLDMLRIDARSDPTEMIQLIVAAVPRPEGEARVDEQVVGETMRLYAPPLPLHLSVPVAVASARPAPAPGVGVDGDLGGDAIGETAERKSAERYQAMYVDLPI
jgi:hypothetical protein